MYKKIFILLLISTLLVGTISAIEWDNVKEVPTMFSPLEDTIRISNSFLYLFPLGKVADIKMLSNEVSLINAETTFQMNIYGDYENPITNINFEDTTGKDAISKMIDYKWYYYDDKPYEIQVPNLQTSCIPTTSEENGTKYDKCETTELKTTHTETRTNNEWTEYKGGIFKEGTWKFKIIGHRKINAKVDFIPTLFGVELKEYAWWDSSWSNKRKVTFTENQGVTWNNFSYETLNFTMEASMKVDCGDLRFTDGTETFELGYNITSCDGTNANVTVKIPTLTASTTTDIYMYYNNPTAVTTGSLESAYLFYDNFNTNLNEWFDLDDATGTSSLTGTGYLQLNDSGGGRGMVLTKNNYTSISDGGAVIMTSRIKMGDGCNAGDSIWWGMADKWTIGKDYDTVDNYKNSSHSLYLCWIDMMRWGTFTSGGYNQDDFSGINDPYNTWRVTEQIKNTTNYQLISDGTVLGTSSNTINGDMGMVFATRNGGSKSSLLVDYVKMKRYATSSPTYTIGAEQTNTGVSVTQSYPVNATNITGSLSVDFQCNNSASGSTSLGNSIVYVLGEDDGLFKTSHTANIMGLNNSNVTHTITLSADNDYLWYCFVNSSDGTYTSNTDNRTLFVYPGAPGVTENKPIDNYNSTSLNVLFNCTSSSAFTIINTSLFINGGINYTTNSDAFEINRTLSEDGNYSWYCSATDGINVTINGATKYFTIDTQTPQITIISPTIEGYGYDGKNESLNYSIIDTNSNSCWYGYPIFSSISRGVSSIYNIQNANNMDKLYYNYTNHNVNTESYFNIPSNCTSTGNLTIYRDYSIIDTTTYNTFLCGVDATSNNTLGVITWGNIALNNFSYITPTQPTNCLLNTSFIYSEGMNNLKFWAQDTIGNTNSLFHSFYYTVLDNGIAYTSPVTEGQSNSISGNFTLSEAPTSIILTYNNSNSTPSITTDGVNYYFISNVIAPTVNSNTNISFYYTFIVGGTSYISNSRNQTVLNVDVSTNCSAGTFPLLNINNYEEDLLTPFMGTVEYAFILNNNNLQLLVINGSNTGTNISLCSNNNLTTSSTTFDLEMRFYKNDSTYFYKTYNIQNSPTTNLPISVNLYYLNLSLGTQFKINYEDFYYIKHPGAIIQIQRQYLDEDIYRIVEIPKIGNNGQSVGAFKTTNIRYKLIVIENGIILDTFNDVFPVCQNSVLGTCELNLRGSQNVTGTTTDDFTYLLTKTNTSIILTYIIPSGTPRTITFTTVQNSRFLDNITTCNLTQFASGGTISCSYNQTVGDSIISVEILSSDGTHLYASVSIAEELAGFFLGNNYFIAFVLLLSLGLMFVSSGAFTVVVACGGLLFLSIIFLIKGVGIVDGLFSIVWFIIGGIIILYKIAGKEERT